MVIEIKDKNYPFEDFRQFILCENGKILQFWYDIEEDDGYKYKDYRYCDRVNGDWYAMYGNYNKSSNGLLIHSTNYKKIIATADSEEELQNYAKSKNIYYEEMAQEDVDKLVELISKPNEIVKEKSDE